jgi:hypothetical protein
LDNTLGFNIRVIVKSEISLQLLPYNDGVSIRGHLRKLKHTIDKKANVQYRFALVESQYASLQNDGKSPNLEDHLVEIELNEFLGKKIKLEYQDQINCISCGRKTNKSFNQGYCYPCLNSKAECDVCIIKPELCHFDAGTCRDNDFAKEYCNINHSIYLSLTSGLKIGITRQNQERTRWVDQGAVQAIRIATTNRRYHAGLIEKELAKDIADKTNWRMMLKNEYPDVDIKKEKEHMLEIMIDNLERDNHGQDFSYIYDNISDDEKEKIVQIKYPVLEYPKKITSLNFDKDPIVEGILQGIKGQYLLLDTGVISMRKFAGYLIEVAFNG